MSKALIVIDTQTEFMAANNLYGVESLALIIPYIFGEVQYFRERQRPVIFACTRFDGIDVQLLKNRIVTPLAPRPGELVLEKIAPDAFFQTNLDSELVHLGVKCVTLVGPGTNSAILLTAASAHARGLRVVVPETCVCAATPQDQEFALRQIRDAWRPWTERLLHG